MYPTGGFSSSLKEGMQAGSFKTGKKFYIDTMMLGQLSSEFSVIRLEFDLGCCELFRINPAGKSELGS